MTNTQIRVGVVGTGMWANSVHLAVYQAHRRATIACVCDINRQSAEAAADRFGAESVVTDYEELVARDDINMIDIITPNVLHARIALAALKAGKHVMCEKPMAMSYAEAQQMTQAADEAGVKTGINFSYRGFPGARYAQHIVSEGHIGRIFHVNASYIAGALVNPQIPLIWRLQKKMAGTGVLGDIGAHLIDLVQWITGERITSLVADRRTFVEERPLLDGSGTGKVDVDDGVTIMTQLEGGGMGSLVITQFATAQTVDQRVEIYGEKGALCYRMQDDTNIQLALGTFAKENQMLTVPIPGRFKSTSKQSFRRNVNNFIDAIAEDTEMVPNFHDGLRNQEILEAATISAEERRWVDLPLDQSLKPR